MTGSSPASPIHDADPVPFHQLDPLRFERLLVDLLQEEDGVVIAEQHGISGQSDFGVDAIGFHEDGSCDLVSCKRYQEISPGDLATWSQDMLRHWGTRWAGLRVRRFILATSAVNIARIQIVSQIPVEAQRFRTVGIRYELWGPTRLRSKLAPHRRLTAMYLKEHWADAICGAAAPPPAPIAAYTPIIEAGVLAQMAELQKMLSGEVAARIDAAVELIRQGRLDAVEALIAEVQEEPRWGQLTAEAQARVLRLEGSLALTGGDVAKAEACSLAADARHPPDEPRLAASIFAELRGADSALEVLGRPTSLAGRQLRSALLLAAGRPDDAQDELSSLQCERPDDPETLRLLALQRLSSGRPREAFDLMVRVEAVAGSWMATRRTGAMVRYALALSPSLGPEWILVPNPVDPDLVRRDVDAASRLREAIALLDMIPPELRSHDDETWRLAILANIEGRRAEAVQLARDLLDRSPGDAMVVGWSVVRDFELDLHASRSVLESAYRTGGETSQLRVLCLLLASSGAHEAAAVFLEAHLDRQGEEQQAEALAWIARFRGTGMDRNSEILHNAQRHDDWAPAESLLEELLASDPPQPFGLTVAELVAAAGRWSVLIRHVDRLVAYGVPNGLRLAATAAMNAHRFRKALDLIDGHGSTFGTELPADMRRLRAEALARSGHYRSAIGEAATLAARGQLDDALFEAELRARIGAVQQALPVVKRALGEGRLGSMLALQWSQRVKHIDPDLAKDLVRAAVSAGVEDAHVLAAWTEAVELGLHSESSELMPRVAARAAGGDPAIRTMTVDTVQEFMRDLVADEERMHALHLSGAIPSHLYARGRADVLLRMHRLNLDTAGGPSTVLHPRLVRHGARPLDHASRLPYRTWTLHLDVTGLLEAERSGLLDRLEAHPNGIVVSSHLPEALQQMRSSLRAESNTRAACECVLGLVTSHVVETREWIPTDMTRIRTGDEEGRGRPLPELLRALSRAGIVRREEVIRQSDDSEHATDTDLQLSKALALTAKAILELASSGQLERLCEHLPVVIEASSIEEIRTRLASARSEEETGRAASSLCQRIGDGIAAGLYRLLPIRSDTDDSSAIERQLEDMLSLPASEGSVVCIDDRNLTGYVTAGTVPIVGLTEVASAMLLSGDLREDEHADIMRAYRASGAALLPFRTEEILEPLLSAPIVEGQLVETPDLVAVRRAFAATRTLEPHLKIGPASDLLKDRPDEDLVARSTLRLFSEALAALWSDGEHSISDCLARSDWLLESLRIRRLFRAPEGSDSDDSRLLFEAMQIGHCLDKAWDVGGARDEHADHRINYLNWCWLRLIVPRRGEGSDIVDAVGTYLARFYGALLDDGLPGSGIGRRSYERILLRRTQALPEPISACIRNAGIFPHHVRISRGVQLAGNRIESGRFWRAMREAARYGTSSLRTEGGRRLRLRRSGDRIVVSGRRMQLPIDVAAVLAAGPAQVRAASASFLERLDLLPADAADFQDRTLLQREPSAMASVLQTAEDASVQEKRRQIERLLAQRRGVPLADLEPPNPERLAWYHRINTQGDRSVLGSWDELTQQVGSVEAFVRSAALPCSLPEGGIVDASELDEMVAAARTPMALASAGRLLREANRSVDEIVALTKRFVESVDRWGKPMVEVLQWTFWRTRVDRSWDSVHPQAALRLCWLHAHWIVATFERHGFDPDVLIGSFPIRSERLSAVDRLAMTPAGPADQADPGTVTPVALMMHGLAAILGDMDAETALPADLLARIRSSVLSNVSEELVDPNLLLRDPEQDDALGGFMLAMPTGILRSADLPAARATYVDRAIARLLQDSGDREAWLGLVAFGVRGLDRERTDALIDLLEEIDLFAAADLTGPDPQPFVWRGVLGPLGWAGESVEARIARLAGRCARTFARPLRPETPAEIALNELVEASFYASRRPTASIDMDKARNLLWIIATEWPASAPLLRRLVSRMLDGAAPIGIDALWRLGNDLNRLQ